MRILCLIPALFVCCVRLIVTLWALIYFFFTDEQEAVQKRTFTKWINSHLAKVRESGWVASSLPALCCRFTQTPVLLFGDCKLPISLVSHSAIPLFLQPCFSILHPLVTGWRGGHTRSHSYPHAFHNSFHPPPSCIACSQDLLSL